MLRLILALGLGLSVIGQEVATESIATTVIQPQAILVRGESNSSPIAGYHDWRTTIPGFGYSQIAAVASGFLTYTDNSVQGGTRYCYVATSYSPPCPATPTCGESANSKEVCTTTSVPIGTQLPKTFFAVSDFGLSLPLTGGISLGTLGRIGGIIGFHIEPTCDGGSNQASSCYNWAPLDAWVNFAVSHELMLVYAHSVPGWQCGRLSTQTCTTLPSNLTFTANFAQALATRYAGKIKYHETLNEVNNPTSGEAGQIRVRIWFYCTTPSTTLSKRATQMQSSARQAWRMGLALQVVHPAPRMPQDTNGFGCKTSFKPAIATEISHRWTPRAHTSIK